MASRRGLPSGNVRVEARYMVDAFDELHELGQGIEDRPAEFSDDALALAYSTRHDGEVVFVPALGRWLRWNGHKWAEDDTLTVFDLVRAVCRSAGARAEADGKGVGGLTLARSLCSARTIANAERIARSDPRHVRRIEEFDADPWALNTPSGIVDLRTGAMKAPLADDLHSKATAVGPNGECPRWLQFLKQITQDNTPLVDYLQRWAGYTLTGLIRDHAFLFAWGPGGNGKSVLLGTVAAVLGDYATTAMADVFTVARSEQHPTHLASLRGARMVLVSETEEGRPWAESRIKSLTGGDRISARVMRGDPFEFSPTFKLWIAGNHRPVLRNPDPALRRRLQLVPLTFVPPRPDVLLSEALREEMPGILAWAIRGCLAWQRDGLNPPKVVLEAAADYFAEQDSVANWFAEQCDRGDTFETPARQLFTDWQIWARIRGEEPGTEKRFSAALERLAAKKRTNRGVAFLGIALRPAPSGDDLEEEC